MQKNVLSHTPHDVHRIITEKIVSAITVGPGTYECPWHRLATGTSRPTNAHTGKSYRGVNILSLWADALEKGYRTGHWASYRQWQDLGAQVQKGERGSLILFHRKLEENEDKE